MFDEPSDAWVMPSWFAVARICPITIPQVKERAWLCRLWQFRHWALAGKPATARITSWRVAAELSQSGKLPPQAIAGRLACL